MAMNSVTHAIVQKPQIHRHEVGGDEFDALQLIAAFAVCLAAATSSFVMADEATRPVSKADVAFFERRIRPVFIKNCHKCHASEKQEAGLRLDSRKSVLRGSDDGPVVVAGKPDQSALIKVIKHKGDLKMPPDKKLAANEIADIVRWIKLGAPWPKESSTSSNRDDSAKNHWAFQPISKPEIPDVENVTWPRTPTDRFILAKLEAKGLQPSRPASKRSLIRRVMFDLIGLPPTPLEIDEFLADESPNAFARMVDRLLASAHHGERWGRYWLDVARYADNKGYVFFEDKNFPWAYTYRDYVIEAFNRDLPFDRFVVEQLAADQIATADDRAILRAMGYLTLGARFMNNTHDIADDRIDVVTRGLMGLTVTCARCHDHKFDPIPQADYYSLYGVFRSSQQPTLPPLFSPPPSTDEYKKFDVGMRERVGKFEKFLDRLHGEIVNTARSRASEYLMAAHARRNQPSTENFMLLTDKGALNPHVILRWEVYLKRTNREDNPVWTVWHRLAQLADDEFARKAPEIFRELFSATAGGDEATQPINHLVRDAIATSVPMTMKDVADRYGKLLNQIDKKWREQASNAASNGGSTPERLADDVEEELRQVLYGADSAAMIPRAAGWGFLDLIPDRPTQAEFKKLIGEVEKWSKTAHAAPPRAMVMVDAKVPYQPAVFLRGNPNRRGESVPRQFLEVLSSDRRKPFAEGSGRLELARAIVDPRNPLTARIIVNRVWSHHFGHGLVTTPSDFGTRSDPPSHPQLLDHLANRLSTPIAKGGFGWSLKKLHREILLSAVYQQSSEHRADAFAIDPKNRLLARMNRSRLDFEGMRDALLSVSGDLNSTIGGTPVRIDTAAFVPRRSVYGFVDRMNMPNLLRSFDFPSPVTSSPKRSETTVPPQALFMMNHDFVAQCARRLTKRVDSETSTSVDARIRLLYQYAFGREATGSELELGRQFIDQNPQAWQSYAHAMLMTNEFVFVD